MEVGSKNPFDLLGDESENDAPAPTPAAKGAAQKPTTNTTSAPSKTAVSNERATPSERSSRNDYPRRGGAKPAVDGQRPPRFSGPRETNGAGNGVATAEGGERPYRPRGENSYESSNGGGRGRGSSHVGAPGARGGGFRGRGGPHRGREYDRRSGRVDMDSEKKEVAGKGTWGDPLTAESAAVPAETTDGAAETTETEVAVDGAAPAEGEAAAPEPVEEQPEDKYKSLDDYFKELAAKKPTAAAPTRKANEGADVSQWKDAVVFQRGDEEEVFIALGQQKAKKAAAGTIKEKVQVDLDIRFTEPSSAPRGRGGNRGEFRGGRGGPRRDGDNSGPRSPRESGAGGFRGGRGAGGPRGGGRGSGPPVRLEDTNAFPSLGK
ncbi:hypothetical protein SmJEL517_g01609 [Synchytrium microbalum]|uniref:Hyaluronan/mRNA-binding protein domain-containing protein n=1 Tax=Synchytrium microbalum TaxID=1806994 RepID=A0A507CAV2_9FUNG|nr:uncharacterized protein SmJEL517_g01609 [Synchytrium microbalum]TPX36309.1 hypothetical protein SmJEL517_g01609 [Synchytrium microbalum]